LNIKIEKVKDSMNVLKKEVENDLDISKKISIIESEVHTFLFEVDKIEGDKGMRKSKTKYKIVSVKNRLMVFTC
jgi:hypothetical protein